MPRNVEENVYVTIAFARDSLVLQRLQREAAELDISVAHLMKMLLADRSAVLEGHGKHLWFPREINAERALPVVSQTSTALSLPTEDTASKRLTTAAAAASYWED
jgi:hypothetical protein